MLMRNLTLMIVVLLTGRLFGQTNISQEKCTTLFDTTINRTIYLSADTMPEFTYGQDSLMKFLSNNVKFPDTEADCEGIIFITFIVETDGKMTNHRVLRGICAPFDKEALRVAKLIPTFKAGKCDGKNVPVRYIIPIKFTLQ